MIVLFSFLCVLFEQVNSYRIIKDSCPVCTPCAIRPPKYSTKETKNKVLPPLHSSEEPIQYFEEFRRMSVVKDQQESLSFKTVDLGKFLGKEHLALKSLHRQSGDIIMKTTTKRVPSTIPTATPFAPTLIQMKEEEIFTTPSVTETSATPTTAPYVIATSTPTPREFGRDGNITEDIFKDSLTTERLGNATILNDFSSRNATSGEEDVQLVPAGYQTNPMFSPDEINIEDEKCNDLALQKLLVEGMRVDDSVGSKRSIGALLAATEITSVSVLCSEQNLAFRLVARKHCQLSSGKTTCVVFQL